MIRYEADILYNEDLKAHFTAGAVFGALKLTLNHENELDGGIYLFGHKIRDIDQILESLSDHKQKNDDESATSAKETRLQKLVRLLKNRFVRYFKDMGEAVLKIDNHELRSYILNVFKEIMIQLLPRRVTGDFRFGLDDPYYTGKVMEIFALLYTTMGNDLKAVPVWDQLVFNGNIGAYGKVHVSVILWNLTKVLIRNDFRRIWRKHNGK